MPHLKLKNFTPDISCNPIQQTVASLAQSNKKLNTTAFIKVVFMQLDCTILSGISMTTSNPYV